MSNLLPYPKSANQGHYLNYLLMINIYTYYKMIRFNYFKTDSNIHNIQYTWKIHVCNKKALYIPFYNISTLLVIIFSVYELRVTQVAP